MGAEEWGHLFLWAQRLIPSCLEVEVLLDDILGLQFCAIVLTQDTDCSQALCTASPRSQLLRPTHPPSVLLSSTLTGWLDAQHRVPQPSWHPQAHCNGVQAHQDQLDTCQSRWQLCMHCRMLWHRGWGRSSAPLVQQHWHPLHLQQQCLPRPCGGLWLRYPICSPLCNSMAGEMSGPFLKKQWCTDHRALEHLEKNFDYIRNGNVACLGLRKSILIS